VAGKHATGQRWARLRKGDRRILAETEKGTNRKGRKGDEGRKGDKAEKGQKGDRRIFVRDHAALDHDLDMPRRPRLVVPGIAHHVTQRGNNRQAVFAGADDRRLYLQPLTAHASQSRARLLGYCLMTNHVHLIVVPEREDSLARAFGRTHAEYAQAVNREEHRTGHLWRNRFFSCPLDASHLQMALRYVDLNPVRAGLSALAWQWPWSSARARSMAGAADPVLDPAWAERIGGWDFEVWQRGLVSDGSEDEWNMIRRATQVGEPLGSRQFVKELERQAGRRLHVWAKGRPHRKPESGPDGAQACLFGGDSG
jgi:REP-associated tyrosine transposase